MTYSEIMKKVVSTYATLSDDEMFHCPECDEPIFEEDWDIDEIEHECPICGFNWETGEIEDDEPYDEFDEVGFDPYSGCYTFDC